MERVARDGSDKGDGVDRFQEEMKRIRLEKGLG